MESIQFGLTTVLTTAFAEDPAESAPPPRDATRPGVVQGCDDLMTPV
ncbi:hypothetical protein ACL02T_26420 [Pseudonocardia sp. RS010]